jgi:hypothetical protein
MTENKIKLPEYIEWTTPEGETVWLSSKEADKKFYEKIVNRLPFDPREVIGKTLAIVVSEQIIEGEVEEQTFYIGTQWLFTKISAISISIDREFAIVDFSLTENGFFEISLAKTMEGLDGFSTTGSDSECYLNWLGMNFVFIEEDSDPPEWRGQLTTPRYKQCFDIEISVEI